MCYLGIDTSNYTTSAALFNPKGQSVRMYKQMLPIAEGTRGLKQSDAVFAHVKQLGKVMQKVMPPENTEKIKAVGVSTAPRRAEGSYMPCFLVGDMTAESIAAVLNVKKYTFSHQEGHIAAAAYSAGQLSLLKDKFLAFHVSGGTTECLLVQPDQKNLLTVQILGGSSDLKAGQAIDRIGVKMQLPFPAGMHMEKLAMEYTDEVKVCPSVNGTYCSLSGLENQCYSLLEKGHARSYIAKYCMTYIQISLEFILKNILEDYAELPILFAGGVMSNKMLQTYFQDKYNGYFAKPDFSADNGAGVAILAWMRDEINAGCCI